MPVCDPGRRRARPAGKPTSVSRPGAGPEVLRRVLGVEARLDRVRRAARRAAVVEKRVVAGRAADHPLDEIDAGDLLGDAVLDLQAGVDLEEVELVARRRRRGTRPCRPSGSRRAAPSRTAAVDQRGARRRRQVRAPGVSSMTFWLRRCSEQSRSPSATTRPCAVAEDLHLDVAGAGDEALEEDAARRRSCRAPRRATPAKASRELRRVARRRACRCRRRRRCLEHHRDSRCVAPRATRLVGVGEQAGAGQQRHAAARRRARARVCFRPKARMLLGRRADEGDAGGLAGARRSRRSRSGSRSRDGSPRRRSRCAASRIASTFEIALARPAPGRCSTASSACATCSERASASE